MWIPFGDLISEWPANRSAHSDNTRLDWAIRPSVTPALLSNQAMLGQLDEGVFMTTTITRRAYWGVLTMVFVLVFSTSLFAQSDRLQPRHQPVRLHTT